MFRHHVLWRRLRRFSAGSLLSVLVAGAALAADSGLIEIARQEQFSEPRHARLLQYQLLNHMQQLNVLYEQETSAGRQKEIGAVLEKVGKTYERLGMPVLAAFYFNQALQLVPESSHYQADLASNLVQIGEDSGAEPLLVGALTGSDYHDHIRSIAVARMLQGDYAKTDALLRKTLRESRDNTDQHYAWLMLTLLQPMLSDELRQPLPKPPKAPKTRNKEWPVAAVTWIMEPSEDALVAHLRQLKTEDMDRYREQLCEALFYRGWYWFQAGERERSEAYFRATLQVNLPSFYETRMARHFLKLLQPAAPVSRGSSFDPTPVS